MAIEQIKNTPATFSADTGWVTKTIWLAQTFTTTDAYKITSVSLQMTVSAITSGILGLSIQAVDGSSKPDGTDLTDIALKSIITIRSVTNDNIANDGAEEVTFNFNTPYALEADTTYAIVIRVISQNYANGTPYIGLNTGGLYAGGKFLNSSNSGTSWTASDTIDFWFKTYSNYEIIDHFETGETADFNIGETYWGGQTFTASENFIPKSISLYIDRPADVDIGAVVVSIKETDVNEVPTGDDLTVGTVYSDSIPVTSPDWIEFDLDTSTFLTSGTLYAIVVRNTNDISPAVSLQYVSTGDPYEGGTQLYSDDFGATWADVSAEADDVWFRVYGTTAGAGDPNTIETDTTLTKKLIAIGSNELWYTDNDGSWVVLSDSVGEIDTTKQLTTAEAYGKLFIANGNNKKVADFSNIKITTLTIGTNPPDFGTVLTGSTSGAVMVVDYINTLAGAMTIYGRRVNNYPFQAEVVTGVDDDGNAISFTCTAEVRPPHFYDWTTFGNSTNYGSMPDHATLVSRYNGRLVLAGSEDYPHEWWMSSVYNPFDFYYNTGAAGTALSSGSTEAGEISDVITALIPYADDFFIFGCQSSMFLLDGDPTYGGTIEKLTESEGIYGARAWCQDNQSNLYFFSGDGVYRANGGRSKPVSLSLTTIPQWSLEWENDRSNYRVVLSFDPVRNGILISHTGLVTGENKNYWYSLITNGFFPEKYTSTCGIFSSYFYNSLDATTRTLLCGCKDGYLRTWNEAEWNDVDTSADSIINSWAVLPVMYMNTDLDEVGKLKYITMELGKNGIEIDGTTDASLYYEIFIGDSSESLLEDVLENATAFTSGTLTTSGKSNKLPVRGRGQCYAIKVGNYTTNQSWALNRVYGEILPIKKG